MSMITLCLFVLYAALACSAWFFRLRRPQQVYPLSRELAALSPLLLLHGAAVLQPVIGERVLIMGFGYAVSLTVWLMLMLYFCGSFYYRLGGLQLLLYPLAAVSMAAAAVFPGSHSGYAINSLPTALHLVSSLTAYGLFGLSALLAVLILWLSRRLHRRSPMPAVGFLPPLLSLEKMMFQGLWAGFALLTAAVLTGTLFAEHISGRPVQFTHKSVFGTAAWLIYALLLAGRLKSGLRGKRAAVWTIAGFVGMVLAYVGSKFVLEVLLHRVL